MQGLGWHDTGRTQPGKPHGDDRQGQRRGRHHGWPSCCATEPPARRRGRCRQAQRSRSPTAPWAAPQRPRHASVLCYGAAATLAPPRSGGAIDAQDTTAVGAWRGRRCTPAGSHGRHLMVRPAPPTHGAPLAAGGAIPGAHLKPRGEERDTVGLLVSGTAVTVAGALLAVRHDLLRQAAGVVLLVLGYGVAGWGVVRLLREQQPPRQPTQAAVPGPPGVAGLARRPRRDRRPGWPRLGRAGRPRRGAEHLVGPGRWDHGVASRSATALAAWRGWWSRRRLPVQRRPARHARTRSRGLGQ